MLYVYVLFFFFFAYRLRERRGEREMLRRDGAAMTGTLMGIEFIPLPPPLPVTKRPVPTKNKKSKQDFQNSHSLKYSCSSSGVACSYRQCGRWHIPRWKSRQNWTYAEKRKKSRKSEHFCSKKTNARTRGNVNKSKRIKQKYTRSRSLKKEEEKKEKRKKNNEWNMCIGGDTKFLFVLFLIYRYAAAVTYDKEKEKEKLKNAPKNWKSCTHLHHSLHHIRPCHRHHHPFLRDDDNDNLIHGGTK